MSKPRKWWRVLALLMTFTLVAAACGDDGDDGGTTTDTDGASGSDGGDGGDGEGAAAGASVDGTLAFGSILPLTGDLADFGPGMQAAIELAIDDINAAGGVLDNDVTLVSADSGTDPELANQAAEGQINNDNVDAIMGAAGSTVTLLGPVPPAVDAGRLVCSGSATGAGLTALDDDGLFFRTAPSDAFQSQLLGDTIAGEGFTDVAIIFRSDDYGQGLSDTLEPELEERNINVVANIGYNVDNPDFDADVGQIVDASPEAVVVIAFPEEGGDLLGAMIEQGVGPADVQHYYTDGLASDEVAAAVDPNDPTVLDSAVGTRPGASDDPDTAAATDAFNTRLTEEKEVAEVTFAAQFYDCTVMTALAAVSAGSDDPRAIADAMLEVTTGGEKCVDFASCLAILEADGDIDFDGITGFDLNDVGEPDRGVYEVWTFTDGAVEGTETVELST